MFTFKLILILTWVLFLNQYLHLWHYVGFGEELCFQTGFWNACTFQGSQCFWVFLSRSLKIGEYEIWCELFNTMVDRSLLISCSPFISQYRKISWIIQTIAAKSNYAHNLRVHKQYNVYDWESSTMWAVWFQRLPDVVSCNSLCVQWLASSLQCCWLKI